MWFWVMVAWIWAKSPWIMRVCSSSGEVRTEMSGSGPRNFSGSFPTDLYIGAAECQILTGSVMMIGFPTAACHISWASSRSVSFEPRDSSGSRYASSSPDKDSAVRSPSWNIGTPSSPMIRFSIPGGMLSWT